MTKEEKKETNKKYYEANKERLNVIHEAYNEAHKEQLKAYSKDYRAANTEKIKAYGKVYRADNKEKVRAYRETNKEKLKAKGKDYRVANKKKRNAYDKAYKQNRMQSDVQYKMGEVLRARVRTALKGNAKAGSAVRDLGCSIEEFKKYIESKWQPGMNWKNWSHNGWHLDHIIPLATFDLTDRRQFLSACNYKNYQPLWASENLSKGDDCSPVDRFFLFH